MTSTFKKLIPSSLILSFALTTGCVPTPDATEAQTPDTKTAMEVAEAGSAEVNAKTQIGGNFLYEITPKNNTDLTCFVISTHYTGSAASGDIDCLSKGAKTDFSASAASVATIETATKVDSTIFYEVTPATRPDISCFITTSKYTGSAVSGGIKCLPKKNTVPTSIQKLN